MKSKKEIENKIEQWEEVLSNLNNLILRTEDKGIIDIYLKSRRELEDSIKLLEWVLS